jgi:hypothetical protein
MDQQRSDSYFLVNGGHPRAVFSPPTDPKELLAWNAWLKVELAAIAVSTAVALFWMVGGMVRPLGATVQIERSMVVAPSTGAISFPGSRK